MTAGAAACFGCGALDSLQSVGDTMFCRACLGRMLRRVDERAPAAPGQRDVTGARGGCEPTRPVLERTPPARDRSPTADAPCFLCGEPLDGEAGIALRGVAICARCADGLLGEDAVPGAPSAAVPAQAMDRSGERSAVSANVAQRPAPPASPPWAPGSGTEWCNGCRRAMPGPGSYVLIDGRPHCAACAATQVHDRLRRGGAPPVTDACDACDACGRALGAAPVAETDGFRLCAACLHSDRELAVALARARHQHRLARASRRVLDGEDE